MACQTPQDLNFYHVVEKKDMKSIDAIYQVEVGYWAQKNFLQDYKIYVMVIYMQGLSQQLMTTTKKQSMAMTPNKSKLQNSNF
jgi:hypothetical protein